MKLLTLAYSSLLLATTLSAFEPGQLSLDTVSNFDQGEGGFTIRHRFLGEADDTDSFAGLDDGANTFLSLRYAILKNFILEAHHITNKSENNIRLGYAHKFSYIHTQLNLNYFQFKEGNLEDKRENVFANLVFQTPLLLKHIILTTNIGYDNYYEKSGAGFGLELSTENFMPEILTYTQNMSILGEYYTKYEDLEGISRKYNAYTAGVKFTTHAHHFELLMTNSTANNPRNMMLGTNTNDVHFAFNINRKF